MSTIKEIFLALALALLITGLVGYGWVLSEQKKADQLLERQQERLNNKFVELDKLLDGKINVRSLSSDVSEEDLQEELEKHQQKQTTTVADVMTISIICLTIGLTIFAGWLVLSITYGISEGIKRLKKYSVIFFRYLRQACHNQLAKLRRAKSVKPAVIQNPVEPKSSKENISIKNVPHADYSDKEAEKINVLYCDEKSHGYQEQVSSGGRLELNSKMLDQLEQNIRKTILSDYHQKSLEVQNSLKAQNDNLEKQVLEVRQMAQTIQEESAKNSEPVKSSIDELAKQVSAIREYTSFQRERIEKLQEGYDWNIIRTFCLRVIRCIDNLENRIEKLSAENIDTANLEEIMDELIFALESSGVEQFKLEINSDYNGKERIAEVVKERACTDRAGMSGKIAEVVKPGYQYVIDDGNTRIVRAARVRLFS